MQQHAPVDAKDVQILPTPWTVTGGFPYHAARAFPIEASLGTLNAQLDVTNEPRCTYSDRLLDAMDSVVLTSQQIAGARGANTLVFSEYAIDMYRPDDMTHVDFQTSAFLIRQ